MTTIEQTAITKGRFMDLEKTVAALSGQLRTIQWGLQQTTAGSLTERFWSLMRLNPGNKFMSTVCNQRVRSNKKVVTYDRPRT